MIQTIRRGRLEYLAAEGIGVPHAFTTRFGGVSTDYLSSLNLAPSRGDAPENVVKNYAILGDALGFDPKNVVLARQVHSDIVYRAEEKDRGAGLFAPGLPDCDALVTDVPGLALVVFSADCTPVLVWDSVTGAVGAAHAGWRGTALGIAARVVEKMEALYGCKPEDLCCAVGPNIGQCHFETDADVHQALLKAFGEEMNAFIEPRGEKFHVDLKGVNAWVLRRAGVKTIDVGTECTMCTPNRFWSHRVTQGHRGSQGAIILCGEAAK